MTRSDDSLHPPLGDADLAYVTRHYATLVEVCAGRRESPAEVRRLIAEGRLPRPSYRLPDGTEMVPRDYFDLADAAGGADALPAWFARRLGAELARRALDASTARVEREWSAYMDGAYGVCLRQVSPETIAEKARLMGSIERALSDPRPGEPSWCRALRADVDRLDGTLREFAACDRIRFGGPVSRDRLVTRVRAEYPEPFASGGSPRQTGGRG